MTLKELSQLYWLNREIARDQRRLDELSRLAGSASAAPLTGMPSAPHNNESKVERMAAEIVDLQAIIATKQIQRIHECARLERWINTIPDSLTRQVFSYRFVDCLSWVQVALSIGGGNTADGVRKRCYRYMREHEHDDA